MATRNKELIRETVETITIRYRRPPRTAYCSSCGKPTSWLTAEEAAEIFGSAAGHIEGAHLTETEPVRLLCAGSIVSDDEQQTEE